MHSSSMKAVHPGWTTCQVQLQRRRAVGLSMVWGQGSAGCAGARPQSQPAVQGSQGGVSSGEEEWFKPDNPKHRRRWALAAARAGLKGGCGLQKT